MKKRFVDVDIWQKEWFQELSLKQKILVKYVFESCDCAGVWSCNFRMASFIIGEKVSLDDIKEINEKKYLFEILPDGKIFIFDFIQFQYGTLSENCKPHKPVIELLKKYNLFERVLKGYSKGIQTLEEKEKEIEIEQEEEKKKKSENENESESVVVNADLMFDKNIEKVFKEYENTCVDCLPLKFEKRNLEFRQDILNFLQTIKFDFEYVSELCRKANDLKKIFENPIDIKSMLKNHERITNGFYAQNQNTTKNEEITSDDLMKQDSVLNYMFKSMGGK